MGRAALVQVLLDEHGGELLPPRLQKYREPLFRLLPDPCPFPGVHAAQPEWYVPGVHGAQRRPSQFGGVEREVQHVVARSADVDGDRDVTVFRACRRLPSGVRQVFVLRLLARPYEDDRALGVRHGGHGHRPGDEPANTAEPLAADDQQFGVLRLVQQRGAGLPAHLFGGDMQLRIPFADLVDRAAQHPACVVLRRAQLGQTRLGVVLGQAFPGVHKPERQSSAQGFPGRPMGRGETLLGAVQTGHDWPRHDRHLPVSPLCSCHVRLIGPPVRSDSFRSAVRRPRGSRPGGSRRG